jgi:hypothetical protein
MRRASGSHPGKGGFVMASLNAKSRALTAMRKRRGWVREDRRSHKSRSLTAIRKWRGWVREDRRSHKSRSLTAIRKRRGWVREDRRNHKSRSPVVPAAHAGRRAPGLARDDWPFAEG